MSERNIRRHITLSPAENEIINNFIKKQGVSFSEFLWIDEKYQSWRRWRKWNNSWRLLTK